MRSLVVAAMLIAAGFGPTAAMPGEWLTDAKSAARMGSAAVPDETSVGREDARTAKAAGPGMLTIFKAGTLVERNDGGVR